MLFKILRFIAALYFNANRSAVFYNENNVTCFDKYFVFDFFDIKFAETSDVIFIIKNGTPICVKIKSSDETQYFKKQKNLKGTRRTLDATFGKVPLDNGLITKDGAFLLDDSTSFLFDDEGHFVKRSGGKDYYCFAYGKDYSKTIKTFFELSGYTPLVPRFALGRV